MKFRNRFMKYYVRAAEDAATDDGAAASSADGGDGEANSDAGAGGEDGSATGGVDGFWPSDWRDQVAKGDDKLSRLAGRYASPEAVFEALVSAQNRIRSGELKSSLPENPTDEEMAAWRADNGIPEKPTDYDLSFDSGLVISDEDKPLIDAFLETAHSVNMTPAQVKAAIEWNEGQREQEAIRRQEMDEQQRQQAQDTLNVEWGNDFRRNINMVSGLLNYIPESVRSGLTSARLPDGTALFNHPDVLRGFAALAGELNPAGVVVPAGGGDPMKGVDEEIGAIEKTMRENRTAYNKDEAMQARYRELITAREKLQSRR